VLRRAYHPPQGRRPLPALQPVPGHPHASYRTYTDAHGQFWVEGHCTRCGPAGRWLKPCNHPELWQQRVYAYARLHGHGVRPRAR
jgi:hypothetical protein